MLFFYQQLKYKPLNEYTSSSSIEYLFLLFIKLWVKKIKKCIRKKKRKEIVIISMSCILSPLLIQAE